MPNLAKKETVIRDIQNNFSQSRSVIFYNFHWIEDREIFYLKKELKKLESYWKIYKNNLVKKALPNYSLPLKEANAFIFCYKDEYKPLNVLAKFSKEHPSIKRFQGGIYNQSLVDGLLLEKWASLPNKEVLISNLCYYLSWHVRRLVKIMEKVKEKKING